MSPAPPPSDDDGRVRPELAELRARIAATHDAGRPDAVARRTRRWLVRGLASAPPPRERARRFIDTW